MSDNKKNQKNHDHSHHEGCGHDHSHEHSHEHHDGCGHDHSHEHHDGCGHNHSHEHTSHKRHNFSADVIKSYEKKNLDELMEIADNFLTDEEFGKVVPIFEIGLAKLLKEAQNTPESQQELINLKQNLAFTYGIIGEHAPAIPLWTDVISFKEVKGEEDEDLLDDYFGMALSLEQCDKKDDFLKCIQKGLSLAKKKNFEEYVASFEHELGGFYCDAQDYEKSQLHLTNALTIREKQEDVIGLTMTKLYLGILFEEQKLFDKAKFYYEQALELSKNQDHSEELHGEREEIEMRLSKIQNSNLKNKLNNLSK